MFPQGLPGIALVLLRVSVALTVLLPLYARHDGLPAWFVAALLLLAMMLVVGFLTPILGLLAMAVQFIGAPGLTLPSAAVIAAATLNALALALLGPGAYSLDAVRFGRRVVDLPAAEEE